MADARSLLPDLVIDGFLPSQEQREPPESENGPDFFKLLTQSSGSRSIENAVAQRAGLGDLARLLAEST